MASRLLETGQSDKLDRYLRLALKAQSQCRTTIETLAVLKNPTTVFARQANTAHGPQQVNNTVNTAPADHAACQNQPASSFSTITGESADASRARGKMRANQTSGDDGLNGWTDARRARYAMAIQTWRPWEQATGPRTPDGKARSARNAPRGGQWRRERELRQALRTGLGAQQDALGRFARIVNRESQ